MNLSEPFIRRPVMTTLVMASFIAFGVVAYGKLPVSDLPNVDYPTLQVSASLPGASPETMAATVATPLEREFSTIAGLTAMNSSSGQGVTSITLEFDLERDLDAAAQDVQSAITAASRNLPSNLPAPPTLRKVNPADQPILFFSLTSPTTPLSELNRYGQNVIAQRFATVPGVAQVSVFGAQKYAARIELDPQALAARGIGLDEAVAAIRAANSNLPLGVIQGQARAFTLESSAGLLTADQFQDVVLAWRNGAPVRVRDVGAARAGVENERTAAWFWRDGVEQRAIVLAVLRQPGSNTVATAEAVKAIVPAVQDQLPAAASLRILFDRSETIQESVNEVKLTLVLTLALVVLVIFLFLRNLPATVIPSLALPVSLVGTFAIMFQLGYSLDNLSLMALTLAVGFVVDDAIVMLENVVRHVEMGKTPFQAALDGSKEIAFTIVSMTISLAAVFLPVLFLGGILGRLFHEFAVTIGAAILVSGFVSLTLTPLLCSRYLEAGKAAHHGRLYAVTERWFERSVAFYDRGLRWSLRHPVSVILFSAAVFVATLALFWITPKGLFPSEDTGRMQVFTEGSEGASFDTMVAAQRGASAVVAQQPEIEQFMTSVGSRGTAGWTQGQMFVKLRARDERRTIDAIMGDLRGQLARFPGLRTFLLNPPPIQIGATQTRSQFQYTLQDTDPDALYRGAQALEAQMRELPEITDVTSDLRLTAPRLDVRIDRDRAAALGLSPGAIEDALYTAYGDRQVSSIYAPDDQYQVIVSLLPGFKLDPASLALLFVRSPSGRLVPLDTVVKVDRSVGPLTVNHAGQLSAVTIAFNLAPGRSLGQATTAVEDAARRLLPASTTTRFQGAAGAFKASVPGLLLLFVMAVLVIYVVLGILYESFVHPVTILTALPFAGFGALVTLLAFDLDLSVYALVGIVMLVGLVKKNGIMMVDFAIEAQRAGKSPREAIHEACLVRFRPIMMTTMAALMGTLPLALGLGAGAEARRPLGLAVVGGLVFSQFLTLYVTPVFYVAFERLRGRRAEPVPTAGGRVERTAAAPER